MAVKIVFRQKAGIFSSKSSPTPTRSKRGGRTGGTFRGGGEGRKPPRPPHPKRGLLGEGRSTLFWGGFLAFRFSRGRRHKRQEQEKANVRMVGMEGRQRSLVPRSVLRRSSPRHSHCGTLLSVRINCSHGASCFTTKNKKRIMFDNLRELTKEGVP